MNYMGMIGVGCAVILSASPTLAKTRAFDLDGYTSVSVAEGLDANIVIGEDFSVNAEARNSKTLDKLDFYVRNQTLYIERDTSLLDNFFGNHHRVNVEITLPEMLKISVSSGAEATVSGEFGDDIEISASSGANISLNDISSAHVDISASSGSEITATGACEILDASASSGSSIDARTLSCSSVDISVSSGADADVFARQALTSHASSGGNIDVYGSPNVTDISDSSGGSTDLDN